jgi:hypothetical protein
VVDGRLVDGGYDGQVRVAWGSLWAFGGWSEGRGAMRGDAMRWMTGDDGSRPS